MLGELEWRSAAVCSDANCELNSLNWNECCEQTTILHTVHKKWGNFEQRQQAPTTKGWERRGKRTEKEEVQKSVLIPAGHIYSTISNKKVLYIGEIFTANFNIFAPRYTFYFMWTIRWIRIIYMTAMARNLKIWLHSISCKYILQSANISSSYEQQCLNGGHLLLILHMI